MSEVTELQKSISTLNKTMLSLAGTGIFNNAKMDAMVNSSEKWKDNMDEIEDSGNAIIKQMREAEKQLKKNNDLLNREKEIKKKESAIRSNTADIELHILKIRELQDKLSRKTNKQTQKELKIKIEQEKEVVRTRIAERRQIQAVVKEDKKHLELIKEENKYQDEVAESLKKQSKFRQALKQDLGNIGKSIKNIWYSSVKTVFSTGLLVKGVKDYYNSMNNVYDTMWKMSRPMSRAEQSMFYLVGKTWDWEKNLLSVKMTAAKFGYDIDKIAPMMNTIANKLKFLKKEAGGGWGIDVDKVADMSKTVIAASKAMNLDSDDMISLLEDRVRKFGDTNIEAMKGISKLTAATLTFNEIMGQGSVFTDEVAKHIHELHQNTKYWVQDFGMLNVMFNSHVQLLLKQGKHQKEALAIARKFQDALQEPPELIKWEAGRAMLRDIRKEIKGLTEDQAAAKIAKKYSVSEGRGRELVKAMRSGTNTDFTLSKMVQDALGGTKLGMDTTIDAWQKYMRMDASVLKDMGLGSTVYEAEQLRQLFKEIDADDTLRGHSMEEALEGWAKREGKSAEELKKMKELFQKTSESTLAGESPYENNVLSLLKSIESLLQHPVVELTAGGIGGISSLLGNTLSTAAGMLFSKALPGVIKGSWKFLKSTPAEAYKQTKKLATSAASTVKNFTIGTVKGAAKSTARTAVNYASKVNLRDISNLKNLARFGGIGAAGALADYLRNEKDEREGVTVNNLAQSLAGIGEGLALLNPISAALSAGVNIWKADGKVSEKILFGLTNTAMRPLNNLVSGVGRIFGVTERNSEILKFINDSTRLLNGTLKTELPKISKEAEERLNKAAKNSALSKSRYEEKLEKILGKDSGVTMDNLGDFIKEAKQDIADLARAESGEIEMSAERYEAIDSNKKFLEAQIKELEGLKSSREADINILDKMELGKYNRGTASWKYAEQAAGYAKNTGRTKEYMAQNRGYFIDELMKHGRTREQAEKQTEAILKYHKELLTGKMAMSKEGLAINYTSEQAKDITFKQFDEMLKKEEEDAKMMKEQLAAEEDMKEQLKHFDENMLKIGNAQKNALQIIAEKSSLDILMNKDRYEDVAKKSGFKSNLRFDSSNGKFTITADNAQTAFADQLASAMNKS